MNNIAQVRFGHIKFPPFKFQEFPKWINLNDGKGGERSVLVNDKAEELRATSEHGAPLDAEQEKQKAFVQILEEQKAQIAELTQKLNALAGVQAKPVDPTDPSTPVETKPLAGKPKI